jgi:hypothetical protein
LEYEKFWSIVCDEGSNQALLTPEGKDRPSKTGSYQFVTMAPSKLKLYSSLNEDLSWRMEDLKN